MQFNRFATFADMVAFVKAELSTTKYRKWEIEAHIYTDEEIWFRPGITIYPKTNYEAGFKLRWNAYDDEPMTTKFIGQRARVEARDMGGKLVDMMLEGLEGVTKVN